MNDWFEWNDVRCTEYGIHVLEQPVLTLPNERATFVDVRAAAGVLRFWRATPSTMIWCSPRSAWWRIWNGTRRLLLTSRAAGE